MITQLNLDPVFLLLTVCGAVIHFAKKAIEAKASNDQLIGPVNYVVNNPWQTTIAIVGSVAMYVFFSEFEQLNAASAFLAGYAGNSAGDVIGKRAPTGRA